MNGDLRIHADKLAEVARPIGEMLYLAGAEGVSFDLSDFDHRDLKVAVARYDRAALEGGEERRPITDDTETR